MNVRWRMGLKDHRGSIHFDNLGRCGFRHGVADGLANLGAPHMQIELVPMRGVGQAQSWEQLLRVPRLPILRSLQDLLHDVRTRPGQAVEML